MSSSARSDAGIHSFPSGEIWWFGPTRPLRAHDTKSVVETGPNTLPSSIFNFHFWSGWARRSTIFGWDIKETSLDTR